MAADNEADLTSGPIHLGATRPPMVPHIGLPLSAAVPLLLIAVEVQMAVTGIKGVAYAVGVLIAIGAPLRVWVSYDWYAIECLMAAARTSLPAMDSRMWGGASVSPFPVSTKRRETRGMTHA
jgi:type IV secretory pathway VirB3-like protein